VKIRGLLLVAVVGGVAYWAYKTHPTVSGIVNDLTRPLMGSKAVVKESEHKRVMAEAAPAASEGEQIQPAAVREGMKKAEVEELLGRPDRIEPLRENGKARVRWIYDTAGRILLFEEDRLVSITVK
jgi:hypothetical protein